MNKLHLIEAAAVAAILTTSCSNEEKFETPDVPGNGGNKGVVTASVSTHIPLEIGTYASHNGGATNADPALYDLRYIIEAWTQEATPKLAFRGYKIVDKDFTTTSVGIDVSLQADVYDFVIWADFVPQGTTEATAHDADLYYYTNNGSTEAQIIANPTCDPGLQEVRMLFPHGGAYDINDDARDAFFKKEEFDLTDGSLSKSIELRRPFGKFRLIGLGQSGYLVDISKIKFEYVTPTLPSRFNALLGLGTVDKTTSPVSVAGLSFTKNAVKENVVVRGVTYNDAYVMAFDYIFADSNAINTATLDMNIEAYTSADVQIGSTRSLTNIPILRNRLTTVLGNYFLPNAHLEIIVWDPFTDEILIDTDGSAVDAHININHKITYPTLDAAIQASIGGDTIFIPTGSYPLAQQRSLKANTVLQGHGQGLSTIEAYDGIRIQGTIEGVSIVPTTPRATGDAWANLDHAGVLLLSNGKVKDCTISGFALGISIEDFSDNMYVENSTVAYNYIGINIEKGANAHFDNCSIIENEAAGVALFEDASNADKKPTFTNCTINQNWATDFYNGWSIPYIINLDGNTFANSNIIISDKMYARVSGTGGAAYESDKYLGAFTTKLSGNIAFTGLDTLGVEILGTVWATRNATKVASDFTFTGGTIGNLGELYQWNRNDDFSTIGDLTGSWDVSWTGSNTTPNINDAWGTNGTTGEPCPEGWRLPTQTEATTLTGNTSFSIYSNDGNTYYKLNEPTSGRNLLLLKREYRDETGLLITGDAFYWTSSSGSTTDKAYAFNTAIYQKPRAAGYHVRCVKQTNAGSTL